MKLRTALLIITPVLVAGGVLVAHAQTTEPARNNQTRLRLAYREHLAANAQRQREPSPSPATQSTDEALLAANFGCPEGTQFWMRDTQTPLCTPLCESDADCGPDEGRCRLLRVQDPSPTPVTLLVDDMTPEELADALAEEDPASSAVELCDPFFDVVGATDADVLRTLLPTDDEVTP